MAGGDSSYSIERELKPGVTWLARDQSSRHLVLKRLPDDCLRQGVLHPSVRDRLERFRELPLTAFATLIGVEKICIERAGEVAVIVSEYVDGASIESAPPDRRVWLLAALRHTIEALHALGLVHGQIHSGNVLLDTAGRVRVLDPSPLLHDDPAVDLAALARLETELLNPVAVAALAAELATGPGEPIRRRTLVAAAVVAGVGVAAGVVLAVIGAR